MRELPQTPDLITSFKTAEPINEDSEKRKGRADREEINLCQTVAFQKTGNRPLCSDYHR
jgi:hypothetical protein